MSAPVSLRAVLVDPSLFTAPYDAALTEGLLASGVEPRWAVRPIRQGDRQLIEGCEVDAFFYRRVDELRGVPRALRAVVKGVAHAVGLLRLVGRVLRHRPHVVHFQWAVVPPLDALAMGALKRWCPVVLTVHDTVPFNGERPPWLFRLGLELPLWLADRVIVHTQSGRERLLERGVPAEKITVIPHGPLELRVRASVPAHGEPRDTRWTFVLFGELKHYKGLDVLIEALGELPSSLRAEARVIIAGRPLMDLAPLERRIRELHLEDMVELRPRRQTEEEMANLFAEADCFLFPYRQVDASGVYFLVKAAGKWLIASRVGIFEEELANGVDGELVPPENPSALMLALARSIAERRAPAARSPSAAWTTIGRATHDVYRAVAPRCSRRAFGLGTVAALALATVPVGSRAEAETRTKAAPPAVRPDALAGGLEPLGVPPGSYRLVKNWDFRQVIRDAAALRAEFFTRYVYAGGSQDHLNDEWTRYRDDRNHVFTADGLSLVARPRGPVAPGSLDSGLLRSRWTGKYGVFEIRMKVPKGRGLWPAFWLNPEDGRWPPEIDVVEIVDNGRDTTRQSFHFLHGAGADDRPIQSRLDGAHAYAPGFDYSDDFHVFSVEWSAMRVLHRVDGVLVAERAFSWRHDDGSDAGPAHVLVNLAVGGKWPGAPQGGHTFPASLAVDYIRVWQQ